MFILTLIEDQVKVQPKDFRNEMKTVEDEIEKFLNEAPDDEWLDVKVS